MAELPPLPTIVGEDLLLDIYTHKSLIPSGAPMNEEYGDTDRLADLGARVLDLAVTFHLHSKRPMLSALEVDQQRAQAITDENIEHWLTVYGIRQKLRFAPSESASVGSPNELRRFFHTYIGAVQIRNGMHTIQRWISQLVDPDIDVESLVDVFGPPRHHASGQDRVAPPPPCSPPSLPLPRSSHVTSESVFALVTLALVNETAAKKKGCGGISRYS